MTVTQGANVYTQGFGSRPEGVEVPTYQGRAPTTTDVNWPLGKRWINTVAGSEYSLCNFSTSLGVVSANWSLLGTDTGALNTLTGGSGGAISPSAGNITLAGTANQITTTGSGSTITFALAGPYTPSTYTAHAVLLGEGTSSIGSVGPGTTGQTLMGSTGADPVFTGSPSFAGSVTAATTITATSGAITATNGNLVFGTAGNKIVSTSVGTTTAAGANSFGSVTLASGTATVATTAVTASSLIVVWRQAVGASTALGEITVGTIVAGTSFVINAATQGTPGTPLATDASVVGWMIIN